MRITLGQEYINAITEISYGTTSLPMFSPNLYFRLMCKTFPTCAGGVNCDGSSPPPGGVIGSFTYDNRLIYGMNVGTDPLITPSSCEICPTPDTCSPCCNKYQYTNLQFTSLIIHGPYITELFCGSFNIVFNYATRVGPIKISPDGRIMILDLSTNQPQFVDIDTFIYRTIINSQGGPANSCSNGGTNAYIPLTITKYYGDIIQTVLLGPSADPIVIDSIFNSQNTTITFTKNVMLTTIVSSQSSSSSSDTTTSMINTHISNDLVIDVSGGTPFFQASLHDEFQVSTDTVGTSASLSMKSGSSSITNTTIVTTSYTTTILPSTSFILSKVSASTYIITQLTNNTIIFGSCFIYENYCQNITLFSDLTVSTTMISQQMLFESISSTMANQQRKKDDIIFLI